MKNSDKLKYLKYIQNNGLEGLDYNKHIILSALHFRNQGKVNKETSITESLLFKGKDIKYYINNLLEDGYIKENINDFSIENRIIVTEKGLAFINNYNFFESIAIDFPFLSKNISKIISGIIIGILILLIT